MFRSFFSFHGLQLSLSQDEKKTLQQEFVHASILLMKSDHLLRIARIAFSYMTGIAIAIILGLLLGYIFSVGQWVLYVAAGLNGFVHVPDATCNLLAIIISLFYTITLITQMIIKGEL